VGRRRPVVARPGGGVAVSRAPTEDRAALWVPLLRRLTEGSSLWAVRGNVEGGLGGEGDIDLVAPKEDWPVIEDHFRRWADEHGIGPVVSCRHVFEGLILIAVGAPGSVFFELEVRAARYFRGGTLFEASDLAPMTVINAHGFREVRPGAEGLLRLVLNGLGRAGRPWPRKLEAKQVPELVAGDPEGVRAAARLFGPARAAVTRAAYRVAGGGWDRRSMVVVEAWALLRAVTSPRLLLARTRWRATGRPCVVQDAITNHGRHIPGDPERWLEAAAQDHPVHPARARVSTPLDRPADRASSSRGRPGDPAPSKERRP
jgi:hypothetical protein